MKTNTNFKVVLILTKVANPKYLIYKQTQDVFGKHIYNPELEATDNETYIRNTALQNEGRLATNSQSKSEFYHLYILSDDEIKDVDDSKDRYPVLFNNLIWIFDHINNKGEETERYVILDPITRHSYGNAKASNTKRIIASTDKFITPNAWIPNDFVEEYIKSYNDREPKPITEVTLAMPSKGSIIDYRPTTRLDGSVIIHQSKMYTREEVIEFTLKATYNLSAMYRRDERLKWIEENL